MPPITRSKAKLLGNQIKDIQDIPSLPKTIGKKRTRKISKGMNEDHKEIINYSPVCEETTSTVSPEVPSITNDPTENTKKIKLSEEESNLNGAPEGELYDVVVLSDENLTPLSNPEEELTVALEALQNTASSWALRHNSIEVIRRACKYHPSLLLEPLVSQSIHECCTEIESLRSSVSRNGISCLKALFKIDAELDHNVLERSIHLLMNKSSGGPKFLCSLAVESLEAGIHLIPADRLLNILQIFNTHKNAEISSRSYSIVGQRCLSSGFTLPSQSLQSQYCQYLTQGLHSFRPQSRDICKNALIQLFRTMNHDHVLEFIEKDIPNERRTEILRLVDESKKAPTSKTLTNKENRDKNRTIFRPTAWKNQANDKEISKSSSNNSTSSSLLII